MTFGYDPYDAEWEHPDTGRTVSTSKDDLDLDDYCPVCCVFVRDGDCPECIEDQHAASEQAANAAGKAA